MSARDRFISVLKSRGMMKAGEEWVIDTHLNEHAHELAEKQRKHSDTMANRDYATGALLAADLIDPEVTSA